MNSNNKIVKVGIVFCFMMGFSIIGCRKFIEVESPYTSTNGKNVYEADKSAIAVMNGIYTKMNKGITIISTSVGSLSHILALSSDDFKLNSSENTQNAYYLNNLNNTLNPAQPVFVGDPWGPLYSIIYTCNAVIEGLQDAPKLTPSVRQQLLGEAKFVRAFCYFYLVNLYGDVPLALTTDYKKNAALARSLKNQVYKQIMNDLLEAEQLLSSDYLDGDALTPYSDANTERVRPTKSAAIALLARTYLYADEYGNAELQADKVIKNIRFYSLTTLDNAFKKNVPEAIWQLPGTFNTGVTNTAEGYWYILKSTGPDDQRPVYLSDTLLKSFDFRDLRKKKWIDSVIVGGKVFRYAYKYKVNTENVPNTEYYTMLRLGEQYLIRAEAKIRQGNVSGGIADLNALRTRATDLTVPIADRLPEISLDISQTDAIKILEEERRRELFTEWGHRWLDLKRTGRLDVIMSIANVKKGGAGWNSNRGLFPIPYNDLDLNRNLVQNPGYLAP